MQPILLLRFSFVFIFFLIFSLLFTIFFLISFLINHFKNYNTFELYFKLNLKISVIEKYFIKSFYYFRNFSELSDYNEIKSSIKSLVLILNSKTSKIQILCQFRPPLTIIIIPTYYIIYCLILIV
jgi:hypothetical protein